MNKPFILGIGGTLRPSSSSELALLSALKGATDRGAEVAAFTAADLDLPFYDPHQTNRSANSARLVEAFRRADGLIIASPGYHGAISGMIKNALDYVEDLVNDDRAYFTDLPVGCIGVAQGSQAAVSVLSGLRTIAHALRAFPTPYGVAVVAHPGLFAEGTCLDDEVRQRLELVGRQVVDYSRSVRQSPLADIEG